MQVVGVEESHTTPVRVDESRPSPVRCAAHQSGVKPRVVGQMSRASEWRAARADRRGRFKLF